MKDIFGKILEDISRGDLISVSILCFFLLLFNLKKVVNFVEEIKRAKVAKLSNALDCRHVSGLTRDLLEEELVREHFKICTGIGVEKEFREAILKAHRFTRGELDFKHFRRALPYFKFVDSKLSVEISRLSKIYSWLQFIFALLTLVFGLLILLVPVVIKEANFIDIFKWIGEGFFFILASIFMFTETFPVRSAKKILAVLNNIQQNEFLIVSFLKFKLC